MRLENKIAIVTGASRGIGRAIADRFVKEGAKVYSFDVIDPDVQSDDITFLKVDVTNTDSVMEAVKQVTDESKKIDILVNNAGITKDNLMLRMNVEDWDRVMAINLKGAFICTKAAMKPMMKQRQGAIINMGSVVGVFGNAGQTNYSASKAGLIGFTKSVAKELGGRNITSNIIAPGFVNTAMTAVLSDDQKEYFKQNIPLQKAAEPEDVANAVLFLASDDAKYITGQVLHVDGGLAM